MISKKTRRRNGLRETRCPYRQIILKLQVAAAQVIRDKTKAFRAGNTCPKGQLTRFDTAREDGRMVQLAESAQRRSQRVFHKMRLQALGRNHEGRKFREICETLVVSAHGGLLNLRHEVDAGEMLVLVNPETQEEQECRIVFLGEPGNRGTRVGVEFLTPAPHFWGIDFEARQVSRPDSEENPN
jgi:hypothetical protein